jgi:SAM-dependent methyltransferase
MLGSLIKDLKPAAEVLDYGCFGWGLYNTAADLGRRDLKHSGSDILRPARIPEGASFHESREADNSISCDSDKFDLVVASHVLEHVTKPVVLFGELVRVCKPGGKIYIECPSDRSLTVPSSRDPEDHAVLNFWDDPTHVRPWTPAGFYRLAVSYGCRPIHCDYISPRCGTFLARLRLGLCKALFKGNGDLLTGDTWWANEWLCNAVIEKPADVAGKPEYRYISLKGVPRGVDNALTLYKALKGTTV